MTTDTWLALGLSLVLIAVIVNSVVLLLIIHWLKTGQELAESIIESAGEETWGR